MGEHTVITSTAGLAADGPFGYAKAIAALVTGLIVSIIPFLPAACSAGRSPCISSPTRSGPSC